jgi:hypothetical protein
MCLINETLIIIFEIIVAILKKGYKLQMNIENQYEFEDDFDEEFYEIVLPEVKGYYEGSQYSKRERYYHHYLNYGKHLYKNRKEAESELFGNIEVEEDFEEDFYEKTHPQVREYMMWEGDWVGKLSIKKRYYHHYLKFKFYKNLKDAEDKLFGNIEVKNDFNEDLHEKSHPEVKEYMMWMGEWISELSTRKRYYHHYLKYCLPSYDKEKKLKKKLIEVQDAYENHKQSIVLVNHVSNPYGATNYLLSIFKILKNKGVKVCLLDEVVNEQLYCKFGIDKKDVISYEQDLLFLCYLYEKLKPKIFYLNSISEIFIDFIELNNPNVIIHSHEIAKEYGQHNILPNYVVSKRIQKEFEDKYNHKPEIQPPILLDEALELIDEEFNKELPIVSNHKGEIDLSKITIGMCGQTESRKNPHLFIEVSKLYPQYNFLWVGGVEGFFPKIDNLYHVPLVKLPFIYYKLMDYFILFSKEDPCPYVILENLYVNNKIITFKENIYTDHKCEQTRDIYFEFEGSVSKESVCHMISKHVLEKAKRNGNGEKYIRDNFTKVNLCSVFQETDNPEDIDYFIICHDQEIILKQIANGTFNNLYNYRFLFVGNGPIDLLDQYGPRVIVCRNLENNIEEYPYLCSFTAWYAVVKNQICKNNRMVLLEYDSIIRPSMRPTSIQHNEIVSYSMTLLDHYVFYKSTPWLEISLKKIYNIDLIAFVNTYKNSYKYWPTTTNVALSRNILDKFVDWFLPMTEMFKDYPLGSYVHERAFFVFCILNKISITMQHDAVYHSQLRSHESNDIYGQVLDKYKSLCLESYMISDYNEIYDKALQQCYDTIKQ